VTVQGPQIVRNGKSLGTAVLQNSLIGYRLFGQNFPITNAIRSIEGSKL